MSACCVYGRASMRRPVIMDSFVLWAPQSLCWAYLQGTLCGISKNVCITKLLAVKLDSAYTYGYGTGPRARTAAARAVAVAEGQMTRTQACNFHAEHLKRTHSDASARNYPALGCCNAPSWCMHVAIAVGQLLVTLWKCCLLYTSDAADE